MNILLSHAGKQHAYYLAKALHQLGRLKRFYTSSYIQDQRIQNLLLKTGNTFWTRRFEPGLHGNKIKPNWRFEFKEIVLRSLFGNTESVQRQVYQRDVQFDRYVARQVEKLKGNHVFWGFQGSCLHSMRTAITKRWKAIYEMPSIHPSEIKELLLEEKKLHPEWANTIFTTSYPSGYEDRLFEELHTASHIVTACSYAKKVLKKRGITAPIHVLPLGVKTEAILPKEENSYSPEYPLKLLFVGRLSQTKGIKYLLEAMKNIGPDQRIELHLLGHLQGNGENLKPYKGLYHYHAPISQQELFKKYREFDVLVLPTLFEGFGFVIIEAMAAGLPVITTPNSMGPDIIREGENGFVIPIRDVAALEKAIWQLRDLDGTEFAEMSRQARRAAESYSWEQHKIEVQKLIDSL